jgi:hypothetical protein
MTTADVTMTTADDIVTTTDDTMMTNAKDLTTTPGSMATTNDVATTQATLKAVATSQYVMLAFMIAIILLQLAQIACSCMLQRHRQRKFQPQAVNDTFHNMISEM